MNESSTENYKNVLMEINLIIKY